MKKILYMVAALLTLAGCNKNNDSQAVRNSLFIDNERVVADGSFIQGAPLNDLAVVVIPYLNATGNSAEISAPEVNGMRIDNQTVQLNNGSGEMRVNVSGMPIDLVNTFLKLNIVYNGTTYISSVEIPVGMDEDPSGTITFRIDNSDVLSLLSVKEIPFTVNPAMAAVVVSSGAVTGLAVKIDQDKALGTGTVTLTPSDQFLNGTVELTATFGVRPVVIKSFKVNGFDGGDGSTATPYLISKAAQFAKLPNGLAKSYKLTAGLSLGTIAPVAGTFTGALNGGSNTLNFTVNTPSANNAALFATLGSGASVSNLTLTGSVTGQDNVAALAAANNGATITSVDASGVTILGHNNIALLSASGTNKDAAVLTFTNTPTSINITQGTTSATAALGITPLNAAVTANLQTTNLQSYSYNTTTGMLTLTMPAVASSFVPGNILVTAKLAASGAGSNVSSTPYTINVISKKMYESGTGVSGDPYMVNSQDQLAGTMTAYPAAYIALMNDIPTTNWQTLAAFSGNLSGGTSRYKVTGLVNPLVATLSGTVTNIAFTGVNIAIAATTGNFGVVANSSSGNIANTAVVGTLARSNTAGNDQPTGGIIGEMTGGSVTNSYVNLTMTVSGNHGGGIVGRCSGSTNTKSITNCTTAGSLTASAGTAFGGILGRILNTSGAVTVSNCNSSMTVTATGSTSNMVGGIFGACQPSGVGLYKIDQCLFTGSVDATAAGGGISGVGCAISNSMVTGNGSSTTSARNIRSGGDANNYPGGGIVASVKDNISKCIVAASRIESVNTATVSSRNTSGICTDRNANTPTVSGCVVLNTSLPTFGRTIIGNDATLNASFGAITNNFYSGVTYYADGSSYIPIGVAAIDGTAGPATMDQAWYTGLGYDFTTVWKWDTVNSRPALQNVGCAASVIP